METKKEKFSITQRKGRCIQVMFDGTDKWVSSGCSTKKDATLWAEAQLRNKSDFLQKPAHEDFKLVRRRGRNIQVQFKGSDSWISSGYSDELNATLWAQNRVRENKSKDITFGEFSENFYTRTDERSFRAKNMRKNRHYENHYYYSMDGRYRNYILPIFKDLYMRNIDHMMIDEWFVSIRKATSGEKMATNSMNKILMCLSNIMKEAVNVGIIDTNPCSKVDKISEDSNPRQPFTEEEMLIMFPDFDHKAIWVWGGLMWASYFHIMKCTGFRPGEIAGLTRDNYYRELGGIYTSQSVNSFTKNVVKRIKTTDKGIKAKIGLLSDQCCRLLDLHIARMPKDQEFLFRVETGYVTAFTSQKHFKSFATKAGIELNGRTQYSLRHTFQTMIAGEVEKSHVEELMGHTKYRQDYDHRAGKKRLEQLQGLRDRLSNII
ncbi:tyrosine-type recombinase/integrase [Sphaerochaeta globosa]|uniref:Integrase family protein n=1 Tax=Sphaerochaeta globosa (strain ATCC BAA-1886 / DSM 22777 / Buddy) TaxID=158189 RepID=F0RWL5_SPHGB|nr:site-specific integrase [Sphaerochaeta globosa]ADY13646.1 integrase family protein [Sphaerochaeta globosa str. Buddy]